MMKKAARHKKPEVTGADSSIRKYRLFADLMKHIPDVIYFKDTSGRLIMVNDAHAKGLGLTPEEVVGKTDFDIFPKERAALMARDDRSVMRTGKPIIDKIERHTRADGVDNYVSTTKIPRYDDKGKILGLIGITRDITKRVQLEGIRDEKEVIEKKLREAQELNRIKSEFISIVSHELRTPLAVIKEAVLLLSDEVAGALNEKQKEILLKARNNIARLKKIIDELLDISRIDSGRLTLHYSLADINEVLRESADFFEKQANEKGIRLEYTIAPKPVYIFIDSQRIHQVIANLIDNAIKFTGQEGSIKVGLSVLEDKVKIGVSDTGVGIACDDVPKLFDKFTQFSAISDAQRKGLGLGLAIVKEFITCQGGEVWAESKPGEGSKFYFTLPYMASLNRFDAKARTYLTTLLSGNTSLYFVNVSFVGYDAIPITPLVSFGAVEGIIKQVLEGYYRVNAPKPRIVSSQEQPHGQWNLILPAFSDDEADSAIQKISRGLKNYFTKNTAKEVFIHTEISPRPDKNKDAADDTARHLVSANVTIKKIRIGLQLRKEERTRAAIDAQIVLPDNKSIPCKTIDISKTGLSFYSPRLLKAGADVGCVLRFPEGITPLSVDGRIRWVRETLMGKSAQYKNGLEFIRLSNAGKRIISKGIPALPSYEYQKV